MAYTFIGCFNPCFIGSMYKNVNDECFKNFLSNKNVYVPYKEEENDDIKF